MIQAKLYIKGKVSKELVYLSFENNHLMLDGEDYALSSLSFSKNKNTLKEWIFLPNGLSLECKNNEILANLIQQAKCSEAKKQHKSFLEKSALIFISVLFVCSLLYFSYASFIPSAAKSVAMQMTEDVAYSIADNSLEILDSSNFTPSKLPASRQAEIHDIFQKSTKNLSGLPELKLVFRSSKQLGANAFSLPNGTIILLDDLVELSDDDEELLSIIGHEIGHIYYRHSLRMLIESSFLYGGLVLITGDITSITTLFALLPVMLMQQSYSRMAEDEADEYALNFMKENGIETKKFADILTKLTLSHKKASNENNQETLSDYFRSHPKTKDRIKRF